MAVAMAPDTSTERSHRGFCMSFSPDTAGVGAPARARINLYAIAWRWHALAGLVVLPFLLTLALTGAVMVFFTGFQTRLGPNPVVEPLPTAHTVSEQALAALARVPDGRLRTYIAPSAPDRAAWFEVQRGDITYALAVDPYRGEVLRADRDGLRAEFLKSDRIEFNFSGGLGLPVNADRNLARRGMPEIGWVLEFGPAMNVKLATSDDGHHDLQLRLPVRAAFALDGGVDYVGTLFAPNLRATFRNVAWAGGTQLRVSTGPVFATADYHRFYYGVEPQFATATRPAFEPKAGYSGWDLSASAARIVGNWRLFAFSGVDLINGARFEDSPLIRRSGNWNVGLGVAFVIASSGERASYRE